MDVMPDKKSYAWHFGNVRYIKPFYVKGQQRLFEVDDSLIEYLDTYSPDEIFEYWCELGLIEPYPEEFLLE